MREIDGIDEFDDQVAALESTLGATGGMAAVFDSHLTRMRDSLGVTGQDVANLSTSLSGGLRSAFDGLLFDGMKVSEAFRGLGKTMVDSVYRSAMRPVTNHLGGFLGQATGGLMGALMPFADGAPFSQGRVMPFAKGGIVTAPTQFPMRGGTGLMGEAGPEAIMPLSRGADGRLGVRAQGGAGVSVVMNISTPDVQGFQRSQSQIAAQMSRALGRGQRNR